MNARPSWLRGGHGLIRKTGSVVAMIGAVLFLAGFAPVHALGQQLAIAAASDLNYAMTDLLAKFEKASGVSATLAFGSSGSLFAQLQNGASFDLYLSADINFPKKLEEAGLTVPGSLHRYAVGRIVFWVPKDSSIQVERGPDVLQDATIKKISIANPKHAPYGRAAVLAMNYLKVYDMVKEKLVLAENVSQAARFVESGVADFGVIALSLALAPTMKTSGRYWEVPRGAHPPLEQGAVIMKNSKNQDTAERFLDYMKGPDGQEVMRQYGFTLPE